MSALDFIMRQPLVYRLWMAPFAAKKFAPIVENTNGESFLVNFQTWFFLTRTIWGPPV
jgi:hypothetical protein